VIGLGQVLRPGRHIRPADDHALPVRFAALDNAPERLLLHEHGAGEDHIRPCDVGELKRLDVQIHQPPLPRLGQQGRDGQEAERREGRALALEREGVAEAPVGLRKLRIHEQRLHSRIPCL
jgi:hypothetical protein